MIIYRKLLALLSLSDFSIHLVTHFKSRYASVSSYLCDENQKYNDMKLVVDEEAEKTLKEAGMDPVLAHHFAHLWIRNCQIKIVYELRSLGGRMDIRAW